MKAIYLDNHSTTPVDPAVLEAMLPYFTERFGNAASRSHAYGWEAAEAVEQSRAQVAALIGAEAKDVIFTSGATESINLAIKGVAEFYLERGNHIITSQTEHRAVLDCCRVLADRGYSVTYLPVDKYGRVSPDDVKKAVTSKTILITIMFANHEIGTIHDIAAIGRIAKSREMFFHCDATQAVGKVQIYLDDLGIDLLSLSGHKIYGPKGVGALYIRRKEPRVRLVPLINGGGHERNHRSGTLNVPGIVGLGKACELMQVLGNQESRRILRLRDALENRIKCDLEGTSVNGDPKERLPGNLNVSFADIDRDALFRQINPTLAVSSGASCTSAIPEPSYVLKAIGVPAEMGQATIRFGIGRFNTQEDIDIASEKVVETVRALRERRRRRRSKCLPTRVPV